MSSIDGTIVSQSILVLMAFLCVVPVHLLRSLLFLIRWCRARGLSGWSRRRCRSRGRTRNYLGQGSLLNNCPLTANRSSIQCGGVGRGGGAGRGLGVRIGLGEAVGVGVPVGVGVGVGLAVYLNASVWATLLAL
jgi:hypothetical protein